MDIDFLTAACKELAVNSPYTLIIILLMFFFSHQNKASLKQINSMFETSLQEIRECHQQAFAELRKMIKASNSVK
ncbi:hypothetical protein EDD70_1565 [Hydrogenoanaerobacterium saccharovorans]|uniref:Uncharacterized protein n=1 Tax=Hydrogenoanaerobacterium saccharovorans TaxID=474960 RepID=A0A1H7Z8Z1_9FIRM|nr:hypothetical protein [Hydrogenoanaerobacterium saccharovorans]RPF48741.1 hypothetical protein EDD70_1565 [Hydrogenoanaerobacterium saccharovorans]SEM55062.1 hypothetical protein SAMN05216180_0525 [Hydrogenoanaerobacterium saccharovorans]